MRALSRRVLLGVGANAAGKFWELLLQLLMVPVLVTKWGADGYGIWLILVSIPTYIGLSDLGFGTAAAVEMTKRVALNDREGALCAFQSVWTFVTAISLAMLVFASVAFVICTQLNLFESDTSILKAAFVLFAYALFQLQMIIVNVAFRSIGRYAAGTFFFDLQRPIEGAALISAALFGGKYVLAALVLLTLRMIGFLCYYSILRRIAPWVRFGWSHSKKTEIRKLARPAAAAFCLPLSLALSIQGAIFVVGIAVSPAAAAMFGTIRTITRVPIQLVGILTRATLPEITVAYAHAEHRKITRLVAADLSAGILLSVPAAIVLGLVGPWFVNVLSRGHINAPSSLIVCMAIIMILQTFWNTVGSFLLALNMQSRFAPIYAVLSAISIVQGYLVAKLYGVQAMVFVLIALDSVMAVVVVRAWSSVVKDNWNSLLASAIELIATVTKQFLNIITRPA